MIMMLAGLVIFGATAWGQAPNTRRDETPKTPSLGEITPTPDMWFFQQQMQQYQDPKAAVRAKAEARSEARDLRLTARRWFGLSNARPRANADPLHGDYSPQWTSNNTAYPDRWTANHPGTTVVTVQRPTTTR